MKKTDSVSWWEGVERSDFSAHCINRFGVNFDHSPVFIVRSEFIKTKGSNVHQLRTYPSDAPTGDEKRRRAVSRGKAVGTLIAQRAMRSGGSLIEGRN